MQQQISDLVALVTKKRDMELKYDLERNVKLVRFEYGKIDINFNENLNRDFIKKLSQNLFQWTNKRWIIAFSKEDGLPTVKKQKKILEENLIKKESDSKFSNDIKKIFPDAELLKVEEKEKL